MKILVAADVHYALPQFDWLVANAPAYDLLILAGDLLDTASAVDPGTQIVVVTKYLRRLRDLTRLVVCSGNHDLDTRTTEGERRAGWLDRLRRLDIAIDGDTIALGTTTITLCPWWDGPLTRDAIGRQLETAASGRAGGWIWVYHAPPNETAISWSGRRHYGDAALLDWVRLYQPDLVVCGHVHEAPFAKEGSWVDRVGETWIFNAGRQIGPVPATIAIDDVVREAAWFSFEGAEAVRLDKPLTWPLAELAEMPAWMTRPRGA